MKHVTAVNSNWCEMIKRRLLQFSMASWFVFGFVFSTVVVWNLETRKQHCEWQFFNRQSIGIILERGWPYSFQSEIRSEFANPFSAIEIAHAKAKLEKEKLEISISSTNALFANVFWGALFSISICVAYESVLLKLSKRKWQKSIKRKVPQTDVPI